MYRKTVTKPCPPDAERKTIALDGVPTPHARVKIAGKWQWCPLNESGRIRYETGPYRDTIVADGVRKTVTLTNDKRTSEILRGQMQQKAIKQGLGLELRDDSSLMRPIEELLSIYLDKVLNATDPRYGGDIRDLTRAFCAQLKAKVVRDLVDMKTMDLIDFREGIQGSPGTKNNGMAKLRSFLKWLLKTDALPRLPAFPKMLKGEEIKRRALTLAELRQICAVVDQHWAALYMLGFFSLARRRALFALKASDFDISGTIPTVTIRAEIDKMGVGRVIPLPDEMREVIRGLVAKHPSIPVFASIPGGVYNVARAIKIHAELAKVPVETEDGKLVFHSLRHGGASHLHSRGVDLLLIARMGGWKSLRMLQTRYSHTTPMDVAQVIRSAWI